MGLTLIGSGSGWDLTFAVRVQFNAIKKIENIFCRGETIYLNINKLIYRGVYKF